MVTNQSIKELVADGKVFSITFIKRTTGEERKMLARTGVDRRIGTGRPWTDEEKNVLTVWDMEKQAYRCIPLENVVRLKHHGKIIEFV